MIEQIWEALKLGVSEYEFNTYMQLLDYDAHASKADLFVFYAPNVLLCHYISAKYRTLLENTIGAHKGYKVQVQVRPKSQQQHTPPKPLNLAKHNPTLNPAFCFETLIVGACNQMAVKIATQVARARGVYNPVLFVGGVGLGKTHLLNAIGNYACDQLKSVLYVTAEQFLNDYVSGLNSHSMDKFQDKYRSCDYLLIDDVQFFGGKEKVQEEFFHTFNALHAQNKQIVMSSDKPPKDIKGLAERLLSRFEMGMIASVHPPTLETKLAIIEQKCQLDKIEIHQEVLHYLASHLNENIRQIEGTLLRLSARAALSHQPITLQMAQSIVQETTKERAQEISLERILRVVASTLNLKPSAIQSNARTRQISLAKKSVIYLARQLTPHSSITIAQFLGLKDHSAVSKSLKLMQQAMLEDSQSKLLLEEMAHKLQAMECERGKS
ncbi:chromosomal replication initiator protein DnaA [Helicobacter vulpis]|uniref:chromosomal replication initiator protein DnaA n=1 Tax=Helicobacter vulpis TaxID=2316076 RepID=UPI000EB527D4|nr:chromosomal replication initiator protein DnaA [Helicobacter vulpis]